MTATLYKYKNLLLLSFTLIYYFILILINPGYITDDFYIIKLIQSNNNIISFSPNDKYFLFLRPVVYLSFVLDIYLLHANPFLAKLFSLLLFIAAFLVIFKVFAELLRLKNIRIKEYDYILLFLLLLTNVNVSFSVIWVANRNEVLMVLFYFLAVYYYIKYLSFKKTLYLLLIPLFYILSIFSKQQSILMPVLLIVIKYISTDRKYSKNELLVFVTLFLIMLFVICLNSYYIPLGSYEIFENLWKKGFWIVNLLIFSIVPFLGDYLYELFYLYKYLAIILFLILTVLFIYFGKKYYSNVKLLLPYVIIYLTTFVHLIINPFSPRSTFMPMIIMVLIISMNYNYIKNTKLIRLFLLFVVILNLIFSFHFNSNLNKYSLLINQAAKNFEYNFRKNPVKTLVISRIVDFEDLLNDRSVFQPDSMVYSLPIYPANIGYYKYYFSDSNNMSITFNDSKINLMVKSDDFYLATSGKDTVVIDGVKFAIIGKVKSSKKYYSSLTIKPINIEEFKMKFEKIAYLDGLKWRYFNIDN